MKGDKKYQSALEQLSKYVRTHDMRPSAVRNMVLEQVCNLHQPFTADQLVKVCATERISVGTVYNSLNLFVKANIIRGHQRQRGQTATEYELLKETAKHMQFMCTRCGRTVDFTDRAIGRLIDERKYPNFNIQHYSLLVYGECKVCRKLRWKESRESKEEKAK